MAGSETINSFVLYGEQALHLGRRCRVKGGDVGVRSRARDFPLGQLVAADGCVFEPDHTILAPSVSLGHHVVCGAIGTDALADDGVALRSPNPFPQSSMPSLPLTPMPATGATAVTVARGEVRSLEPGAYGALTVDGHLVLNPGEYVFSSLTIGHAATVASIGRVTMRVIDYLTAGREARLQPLYDQSAGQLVISIAGVDPAPTSPTASFGERTRLRSLLNCAHGTVSLADDVEVRGAIAAFAIAAGENVTVQYEDGFPVETRGESGSQQLTGAYGVPPGPDTLPLAGPVPPGTLISLSIGLPVRDGAGLQSFIDSVSDPKSAQFRSYMSQATFDAKHGATASDYAALRQWANDAGFTTHATFPSSLLLRVSGTAAQVSQALFVNLIYRERPDGSLFVATDRDLSLNLAVPVLDINGLGDAVLPVSLNGTGSNGTYSAADIRTAYLGTDPVLQKLEGSGQVVGIVDFVTFNTGALSQYASAQVPAVGEVSPLPTPDVQLVATETPPIFSPGPPPTSNAEADLDVQMVYAMAPGAAIRMFQGTLGITDRLDDILHTMANYTPALTVASCSLSFGKSDSSQQAIDQMAAQGVSFFTASGDLGDLGAFVADSTKMNHQTLVGGTILTTNNTSSAGGATTYPSPYYAAEATWPNSGGGIVGDVTIPGYQVGIMALSAGTNGGSTTNRNYPDVAALAANVEIYTGGQFTGAGGTSCAAPFWAGLTALANQMSQQSQAGTMGFLNPTLYDIGLTINDPGPADLYDACFNDIQDGVSNISSVPAFGSTGHKAVRGYDLVTGLGTPKPFLIYQLSNRTPAKPLQPLTLIRFVVGTGGDDLRGDSTATADVFLKNGGQFTVTLKANNAGSWGNGSINGPIDIAIPNTVTLPTIAEGLSGVRINLIQGGSFPETDDNWDISMLQVGLLNPGQPAVCQLNLIGNDELQDGSTGLVRLSGSAGSSGVGPSSRIYSTGLDSGC